MGLNAVEFRETLHTIPFSENAWNELITLIKVETRSQAGVMMITRDRDHDILTSYSPDFTLSQEVRCAFEKSEWITAGTPENWSKEYLNKGVVLGTDIVPQSKMRETPFYQRVLSALGLEYLMAGVSLFGEDYRSLLKFFRDNKQENFSNHEASQLALLMPEIRQMMRFTERLYERMVVETAEYKAGAPRDAATIIINSNKQILHMNGAAENMLKHGKMLRSHRDRLHAVDMKDGETLGRMMANALGLMEAPVQDCALVGAGTDKGLHQMLALPVPVEHPPFPWMEALKVAAIVVIDPMRRVKISSNILKSLYQLTPAETELVNAMANGIKPVQFAALMKKSVPTVQTQRQAAFKKVGVSNQLELMRKLRDLTTAFEVPTV